MASKQNIKFHLDGINAWETREYEHALGLFSRITEPSAPIYYNMGSCHLKLNNYQEALQMFQLCVHKDRYLAVGHFQLGISQTLCGDLASALNSFQAAFDTLRGNAFIDYKQLNMPCKLYACEINFNLGLLYLFSGNTNLAKEALYAAGGLPTDSSRHVGIPEAVLAMEREQWDYFGSSAVDRLVYLPDNSFFRVSKAKMEGLNTSTKFMDSAKVVAAAKDEYSFVGFVGAKKMQPSNTQRPVSPNKRPSPPAGPPPSVPPPRLPKNTTQQANRPSNSVPRPTGDPPSVPAPDRRSSPSRPPPPTMPAPRPKPPPPTDAKKPGQSDDRPSKSPQHHAKSSNMFSELKKSMDNVKLRRPVSPKSTPNSAQPSAAPGKNQAVQLECSFKLDVSATASYQDILEKLADRLKQASSDLGNSLQRRSMTLSVEDPVKKAKVEVASNANWQPAWANVMKNRPSEAKLTLREETKEYSVAQKNTRSPIRPSGSPRSSSPGYKPSRPAPVPRQTAEEDEEIYRDNQLRNADSPDEDDIYHDIS